MLSQRTNNLTCDQFFLNWRRAKRSVYVKSDIFQNMPKRYQMFERRLEEKISTSFEHFRSVWNIFDQLEHFQPVLISIEHSRIVSTSFEDLQSKRFCETKIQS